MMIRLLAAPLLVALSAAFFPTAAGEADPAVSTPQATRLLPFGQKSLRVGKASLRVRAVGSLVAHTLELQIANAGEKEVREFVTFSLDPEASVLGFAVEQEGGNMREAVLLPDLTPEAVAVDPGRLQPGVTRTGKEPRAVSCPVAIPAGEKRRVVFRYAEPMGRDAEGYRTLALPQFAERALPSLNVDFLLTERALPLPRGAVGEGLAFYADQGAFVGHAEWEGESLSKNVCLRFAPGRTTAGIEEDRGVFYAATTWRVPDAPESPFPEPECLGIVWDASASMRAYDRGKPLAFLRAFLKRAAGKTKRIRLTVLRHEPGPILEFPVCDGDAGELEAYLAKLVDDGATGDLCAAVAALQPADMCLIYSDGKPTFGEALPGNPSIPVVALIPGGVERSAAWARVSAVPVDLSTEDAASQAEGLRRRPYRLTSLSVDGREWPEAAATADGDTITGGELSLVGILPEGKHCVEAILTSGENMLVLEETFDTDPAVAGDMLKARYASLLARQAEHELDGLRLRHTLQSISENYEAAVPGYHWGLPERQPPDGARQPRADARRLAENLRAWHERAYDGRAFRARVRSFWKRAADGLGEPGGKEESSQAGEIATGRVPSWLRDDDPAGKPSSKNKKSASSDNGLAVALGRPKVYLTPWRQDAPYLGELRRAADPVRAYEKICPRYARSPGFFVDCSYFFSQRNDRAMAVRIISNLAEIQPDYLPLRMTLALRLLQLEEYRMARACLLPILEKEDASSVYWLLGFIEGRLGNYERAAEYLVSLLRAPGAPEGIVQNALVELNRLRAKAADNGEPLRAGLVDPSWEFDTDADLRLVLVWDSFDSDIDLIVRDAMGERCDSERETTAAGGWRSRDVTLGLGAESFMARRALPGAYEASARVFGPRDGTMFVPVGLCLLEYEDYARPGERLASRFFQLPGRNGGAQLDEVRYEPADKSRNESWAIERDTGACSPQPLGDDGEDALTVEPSGQAPPSRE